MARELFNGASVRRVITQVAPSARVMPVSASPARKSARNRPYLQKAGGREAGDICQLPCAARAISAGFSAPRFPRFTAAMVCASRIVTTGVAGSDDARNASAIKELLVAGSVMPPRDGLPDPSSLSIVQRDPSSRPLPAGSVQCRAPKRQERAPLRALGQRFTSMLWLPTGRHHRCQERVQPWQATKTLHKSGVVSRVPRRSRHAQRSGRTETLTGQAAHTSRNTELERTGITSNRR